MSVAAALGDALRARIGRSDREIDGDGSRRGTANRAMHEGARVLPALCCRRLATALVRCTSVRSIDYRRSRRHAWAFRAFAPGFSQCGCRAIEKVESDARGGERWYRRRHTRSPGSARSWPPLEIRAASKSWTPSAFPIVPERPVVAGMGDRRRSAARSSPWRRDVLAPSHWR